MNSLFLRQRAHKYIRIRMKEKKSCSYWQVRILKHMNITAPFWFWKKLSHGKKNINIYQFELSSLSSGCVSKLSLFYWSSGLLLYKHPSSVLCFTKFSFNLQAHVWNKIAQPTSRNLRQEHTANPTVSNPFFFRANSVS